MCVYIYIIYVYIYMYIYIYTYIIFIYPTDIHRHINYFKSHVFFTLVSQIPQEEVRIQRLLRCIR